MKRFALRSTVVASLALTIALATAGAASAAVFGTLPLNISTDASGNAGNGPSGHPAVSGDNRAAKYVAFDSDASNLVAADANAATDVFVWTRPAGRAGVRLNRLNVGTLRRVSVSSGGAEANGASSRPALDGSMKSRPHCVVFQSLATNLAPTDATPGSDIYVRDLNRGTTRVLTAALSEDSGNAAVDGKCRTVIFEAGGKIYSVSTRGGRPRSLGAGSQPRFSRDGQSMVWVKRGKVVFRHKRRNRTLTTGNNPVVSDEGGAGAGWAVAYNAGANVKLALVRKNGRTKVRTALKRSRIGGISVFAAQRGILVYAKRKSVFYLNRNSGNSDDLAHSNTAITEMAISARSNIVAFASPGGVEFVDAPGNSTKSIYVKYLPQ